MHFWLVWASAALWIAFILYWNAAPATSGNAPTSARRWLFIQIVTTRPAAPRADAGSRESRASRTTHQLLLWCALLLSLLPWFYPLNIRWLPDTPAWSIAGLAVQVAFAMVYLGSKRYLGRYWSGVVMTRVDHKLVRSGPYRWVRHPLYTGMLGMFLGTALVSGELHALLGLGVAIAAYFRKIRVEERHLGTVFGAEYAQYKQSSWALIPGVI